MYMYIYKYTINVSVHQFFCLKELTLSVVNEDYSQSNLAQIGNENLICGCDTGHQKCQININFVSPSHCVMQINAINHSPTVYITVDSLVYFIYVSSLDKIYLLPKIN